MRRRLKFLAERLGVQVRTRVRASHRLWDELTQAVRDEDPALLLLEWPRHFEALGMSLHEALSQAPCDIAIVRGPIPWKISSLLVPMRGGPYAELALRLSLEIYRRQATALTALHLTSEKMSSKQDVAFRGLALVLGNLPEVTRLEMKSEQPGEAILAESRRHEVVLMGVASGPAGDPARPRSGR